jgi:hypothetical protein
MQTAANNAAAIAHDANGEATFAYADHTVYFQDATSYGKKIDLLRQKHPAIGGFAHWAAGQEDPEIWKIIGAMSAPNSGSQPATPTPAPDFGITGPTLLNVEQGSSVIAEYAISPINGFAGSTTMSAQILSTEFVGSAVIGGRTIRVDAGRATPAGVYQMAVRATGGTNTHELLVSIVVKASTARSRAVRH